VPDPDARQQRQVKELEEHTQEILHKSEQARENLFWHKIQTRDPQEWKSDSASFRKVFSEDVIGRFAIAGPANARSRRLSPEALPEKSVLGYEVVLDVLPDVFAWGYLLLPKDIQPGERRPVVVCQHGLEGVPADVINQQTNTQAFRYYKAFAVRLAEQGFVVFAPHNPYRGGDKFRTLQRKANPLGKSLFSIITAQHERI